MLETISAIGVALGFLTPLFVIIAADYILTASNELRCPRCGKHWRRDGQPCDMGMAKSRLCPDCE